MTQFDDLVAPDAVLTGADMMPWITDVWRQGQAPQAVLRPNNVEQLQAILRRAHDQNLAVHVRGGGASYTDGYLPTRADSVLIELGGLNRILTIAVEDGYVHLESGVTWAQLKAALDPLGLRTPFFGPFSGIAATIGGALSQHAISHGSGAYGISAQSVLCLEVMLASGEIVSTGSAARSGPPNQRWFGPDLAGLFLGDCGALGVKVRASLPLIAKKPFGRGASYAFDDLPAMAGFMQAVARERLDDENFGLDRALTQGQIARQGGAGARIAAAQAILAAAPSRLEGLADLIRFGLSGTSEMGRAAYVVHFVIEGTSRAEVAAKMRRLRALAGNVGREFPGLAPSFVRAMPFAPLVNTLGPKGERWVPIHGILTPSRVAAFHDEVLGIYARHQADMDRLGVWCGGMFESVGPSAFLYEIAFYWPGVPSAYHRHVLSAEFLESLPRHADSDAARALVETLRGDLIALYGRYDATHFQLGKVYPYAETLQPGSLRLIQALKREVDPKGLMNPGALGLTGNLA